MCKSLAHLPTNVNARARLSGHCPGSIQLAFSEKSIADNEKLKAEQEKLAARLAQIESRAPIPIDVPVSLPDISSSD